MVLPRVTTTEGDAVLAATVVGVSRATLRGIAEAMLVGIAVTVGRFIAWLSSVIGAWAVVGLTAVASIS
jgi:hypothetical protein